MREEVRDRRRQIGIRIEQPNTLRDDPVAIVIRVACPGDIETILERDQPRHRIRRGTVHPDLSVPIHRHESKGRIHDLAHDRQRNPVPFSNQRPIPHSRAAKWVDAETEIRGADGVEVDDRREIPDVLVHVIVPMRRLGALRSREWNLTDTLETAFQQLIRLVLYPAGDRRIRGSAAGRIVLEAAVLRRIV